MQHCGQLKLPANMHVCLKYMYQNVQNFHILFVIRICCAVIHFSYSRSNQGVLPKLNNFKGFASTLENKKSKNFTRSSTNPVETTNQNARNTVSEVEFRLTSFNSRFHNCRCDGQNLQLKLQPSVTTCSSQ